MVTGMEICEFFIHLFSDWTKVMVITEYVRKPWLRHAGFPNCILKFICCGKIAEPIGRSLGQFDLLKATKKRHLPECVVKLYHAARSFVLLTDDEHFRINKCQTLRPVPEDIETMICRTLVENRGDLVEGRESRKRRTELEDDKEQTHIERIMVWHVATSILEDRRSGEGKKYLESRRSSEGKDTDLEASRRTPSCEEGTERVDYKLVATTLSKYCAYLVFYKPKLLPVASNSVRYMCKLLLDEAKENATDKKEATNVGGEGEGNGKQGTAEEAFGIVSRGQKLADHLLKRDDLWLWKALAELWCELIISMAPLGSIGAHQKELGKGGEFITHLWALLYHAGIDDKFSGSSSGGAADAQPSKDDNYDRNSHC